MRDLTVNAYEAKQNRIYQEDFLGAMQTLAAVQPGACTVEPTAGYIVCWQYHDQLIQKVEALNGRINKIVAAIQFDKSNAHTTITVHQKQTQTAFEPNEKTLRALAAIVKGLDKTLLQAVQIDFRQWLFNKGAVIAAGQPNSAFWQVGEAVQAAGQAAGFNLRMPWGAHMTCARFIDGSNRTNDLKILLQKTPPLALCKPQAIIVAHYRCGPDKFDLNVYMRQEV